MRRIYVLVLSILLFAACNNKADRPDVSDIDIELTTERFEKDFFQLDTNALVAQLPELAKKYPQFAPAFFHEILGIPPEWPMDSIANDAAMFIKSHYQAYDTSLVAFKNFAPYQGEMRTAFQYVKYYFPEYPLPKKIVTYIGPLDGYGDIITNNAVVVGLQHHLGKNFTGYKADWVQLVYPRYITEHFDAAHITINAMKNIINDMYPETFPDKPLIVQMVDNGRRLYLLNRFLPDAKDNDLMGYTEKQMSDCYEHEALIWDLFVQNNYLQSIDANIAKNYIAPTPGTPELGEAAPGNIGSFAGWQIVKKYMDENPATTMQELMKMDAEKIYKTAKYKP